MNIRSSKGDRDVKVKLSSNTEAMETLFRTLISPIDKELRVARNVLLCSLGSLWFVSRIKKEYPNIECVGVIGCSWEGGLEKISSVFPYAHFIGFDVNEENKFERTMLESLDMKFDCVIANPPYNLGKSRTQLHLEVINGVMESGVLTDDATISTIQPVNWLLSSFDAELNTGGYKRFSSVREKICELEFLSRDAACKLFNIDIINPLGIYVIRPNVANTNFDLEGFRKKYGNVDDTGMFEKVLCACYNKLFPSWATVIRPWNEAGEYCVKFTNISGGGEAPKMYSIFPAKEAARAKPRKDSQGVFNFDTDEEAENFRRSVSDGLFYKYISWCYKQNPRQYPNRYPWMGDAVNPRTGIKGYKGEWTDDDLFDYFGISQENRAKALRNFNVTCYGNPEGKQ